MQAYSKYFATYIYIHAYSRYFAAYINIHFGWHFFAISFTFYSYICTHLSVNLIWKAISCYTFMGKEELFLLLIHILKSLFMPYAPILRSIFVPFSAHMHISKALGYLPNTRTLYLPLATYEIHRFLPFLQTARHWSSLLYHQPQIWKKKEDAVAETLKKSWDDYVYFFMFLFCKDCFALCCGCGMLNWKVLARIWNLADRRHRKVEFGSAVTYQREERRGERSA